MGKGRGVLEADRDSDREREGECWGEGVGDASSSPACWDLLGRLLLEAEAEGAWLFEAVTDGDREREEEGDGGPDENSVRAVLDEDGEREIDGEGNTVDVADVEGVGPMIVNGSTVASGGQKFGRENVTSGLPGSPSTATRNAATPLSVPDTVTADKV